MYKVWLEKGGVDPSYTRGTAHSADTPWGTAKGRRQFRRIPADAKVTRRKTTLRWNTRGEMMTPIEKRKQEVGWVGAGMLLRCC
eukprot:COSAG01_NODE_793_length_13551_cov_466.357419_16_plen_84_part_00